MVDNTLMRIVGEPMHNVSMPSGHTLTAFAVASAIYFALPPQRRLRFAWTLQGTFASRAAQKRP